MLRDPQYELKDSRKRKLRTPEGAQGPPNRAWRHQELLRDPKEELESPRRSLGTLRRYLRTPRRNLRTPKGAQGPPNRAWRPQELLRDPKEELEDPIRSPGPPE